MGGSSSSTPPPPTVKCLGYASDKYQTIDYYMYKWNTGKCGDMAVFIREWFTLLENKDTMYLKSGTEFNGRFNKIKGKIKLKIDENESWTYNIDRLEKYSIDDEYFRETDDSIKKYSYSIDSLTTIMDTLSKINNELIAITSTKRAHIIAQTNKISELLKTLTDDENKLLITDFKEILNYRRIVTIVMNDQNNKSNWVKAAPFYNLLSFLVLGVKPVTLHQKLGKDRGDNNFEFIIMFNYLIFKSKIKVYKNEIVKGTDIEQKIKDYRKVMGIINELVLNDSWLNVPSEANIAKNYLTIVFKICDTLISKLKDFAINKITNNTYIDDEKLVELGDTIIVNLVPNIIEAVTDEIGENDNYNNIIEGLRTIRDDYIKLKETINKISVLQVFNQRYKFKCGKFNNKYHMILSFKEKKYSQYLLNPNDKFRINDYPYSPSIYKKEIGPLCVKQKNEKGYRSLERCYDYESKQRCESNLNSIDKTSSAATFKRELIDTINGIDIYGSSAQLFNPNSKLHDTKLNNYNKDDVNKLNENPIILKAKSTTTTVPTTTEYIHKEVIQQPPPETTQAKLLKIPDPIIPNGNYYVSLVDKNGSEKYVNVFKKEINNKIYYFLKTVNKDITKDQSYQDKLKNNSIFTVRNKPFPNYNNKPYNFITIEFKVSNNSNQDTYFLRTEDNTNKVIITNKDADIEKPFNWYFLPEYISESQNENGPIEVYLKPITEDLKDYCYLNNDNETKNDKNLQYIENDVTINPILNILLNNNKNSLNDDENLPIIACNSKKPVSIEDKKPVSYLKFEFHSSLKEN